VTYQPSIPISTPPERQAPTWLRAGSWTIGFVVLIWALEIVDALAGNALDQYGVHPRTDEGLLGILLAPLLHGGWAHLIGNTVPALVLGFLALVSGIGRGIAATAIIWLVGGLGVWLVGDAHSVHLGASVLIFGWLVYLMARGVFSRRLRDIALGVLLFLAYGTVLLGVLPGQPGISWEGHLFGAIGGALAAMLLHEPAGSRTPSVRA